MRRYGEWELTKAAEGESAAGSGCERRVSLFTLAIDVSELPRSLFSRRSLYELLGGGPQNRLLVMISAAQASALESWTTSWLN